MKKIEEMLRKQWAFIVAAFFAPITYLFNSYCGSTGCIGCPANLACSAGAPLIFGVIFLVKIQNRIRALFFK